MKICFTHCRFGKYCITSEQSSLVSFFSVLRKMCSYKTEKYTDLKTNQKSWVLWHDFFVFCCVKTNEVLPRVFSAIASVMGFFTGILGLAHDKGSYYVICLLNSFLIVFLQSHLFSCQL